MSLSELGVKPEGQPMAIPARPSQPSGLSKLNVPKAAPIGPLVIDEPLKTIDLNGKKVTLKESVATALLLANEDMIADTGKGISINESFRSGEQQAKTYGKLNGGANGRVAAPGQSFHQTGQALDVANWQDAEPYLRKYNFSNDMADDKNHFSIGEFNEKPPLTTRESSGAIAERILSGEDTQSMASIAKRKLGEQGQGVKKFAESLQDKDKKWYNPFSDEAFKQGFLLIPKAIPALGAELFKRGYAVGDAAIDHVAAGSVALKMLAGNPLTEEELANIKASNRNMMRSLAGLVELVPDPRTQFVAGMAKEIANTEEKGGTQKEGLVRGAIQGTEQAMLVAVLNRIFNKLTGKDKQKLVEEARNQGIKDADIDAIANKKIPAEQAKEYLDASVKATKSRGMDVKRATELVGDDLANAQKQMVDQLDDFGKKIGDITDDFARRGDLMDPSALREAVKKKMIKLNIKFDAGGNPIFKKSDIASIPADEKLLFELWDDLNPARKVQQSVWESTLGMKKAYGGEPVTKAGTIAKTQVKHILGDIEAKTGMSLQKQLGGNTYSTLQEIYDDVMAQADKINVRDLVSMVRNAGNKLYAGSGEITAGKGVVETFRKGARDAINKYAKEIGSKELAQYNEAFHELSTMDDDLARVIKESGVRGPEFIRRAFSNVASEPKSILARFQDLAKKYGFSGSDIYDKGNVAVATENVAGVQPPHSLKGQTGMVGEDLVQLGNKTFTGALNKGLYGLMDKAREFFIGNPATPQDTFRKLIDKGVTPAALNAPTGALSDQIMNNLNLPGLLRGAAVPTILEKLQQAGLRNEPKKLTSLPFVEDLAGIVNSFIPTASAAPKIPQLPQKPSIPATPAPADNKGTLDYMFPNASAQVRGLMELGKRFGQLTPEQLEAAAPKPKYEAKGIIPSTIKNMNANKQVLEDAMAEIQGKTPDRKKPIAQIFNESDTGKAVKQGISMFKKSFNIK